MEKIISIFMLVLIAISMAYTSGEKCPEHRQANPIHQRDVIDSYYDCGECPKDVTETWSCEWGHSFFVEKVKPHKMSRESVFVIETCPYCGYETQYVEYWRCVGGVLNFRIIIMAHICNKANYEKS